jgi:thiosulfate dehydrogenase [quinone] large subunit
MAGAWKTFTLTPAGHVQRFFLPYQDTFLPTWSLWVVGFLIPMIELLAGALVIAGLFTRPALIALGFVLVIVTFGHLLHEPLYAFHEHVIPRLALLLVVMLMPAEADRYSVDAVIASKRRARQRIVPREL